MEFEDVGRHCELPSCRRHDYLPFYCPDCQKYYCLDHREQVAHQCPVYLEKQKKEQERIKAKRKSKTKAKVKKHPCGVEGCKTCNQVPIYCQKCGDNFCLAHRYPESHQCRSLLNTGLKRPIKQTTCKETNLFNRILRH